LSRLSHGAVDDLTLFSNLNTEPGVGRALWPKTLVELTADASQYGWGSHWHHLLPAAGFFTVAQRDLPMSAKEVPAVRFCLLAFGSQLLGEEGSLLLRVDSRMAMHVINGFSSRSPALMGELRKLHAVAQEFLVTLRVSRLPSVANVWADAPSRQSERHDWRISDTRFLGVAAPVRFAHGRRLCQPPQRAVPTVQHQNAGAGDGGGRRLVGCVGRG